jgi:hypothetical protein
MFNVFLFLFLFNLETIKEVSVILRITSDVKYFTIFFLKINGDIKKKIIIGNAIPIGMPNSLPPRIDIITSPKVMIIINKNAASPL